MQTARSLLRWLAVVFPVILALAWAPAAFAQAPVLISLTPSTAISGGSAFMLTIKGMNFTPDSTVKWGATALPTNYVRDTELTAAVPASLIANAGVTSISVTTDGSVSSGASFTVTTPPAASGLPPMTAAASETSVSAIQVATAHTTSVTSVTAGGVSSQIAPYVTLPAPTITSMSPTSALSSSGSFTLTINGSNFVSGAGATVVRWNYSALATTFISSTQITAVVPASLIPFGSATVTVVTSGGTSSGLSFTINPAQPVINSMSPKSIAAGSGAFTISVFGSYFDSNTVINWGAAPLATTSAGGKTLTAEVPSSLITTVGTVNVTVTNAGGTSAPVTFSIALPPPVITSLSPASVPAGGAAFTLTVSGANFDARMNTYFESTWIGANIVSSTQLTATVPASLIATAGEVSVSVYESGGGWSTVAFFTVTPAPPAITSITPAAVTAGGAGFMLTVSGKAFTPDATVIWGANPLYTIYIGPTQLRVSVPASLIEFSGTGSITVATKAGTSAPATFTINQAPPAISGLSPGEATAGGPAFKLTISGAYFTSNSTAKWGTTALATTYISQTQLTAVVPANLIASAGTASVSVTTSAGKSASVPFTINPAIKITTTTLPTATAGNAYSGPINVTGGSPGYTWTVTGLPSSMSVPNTSDSTLTITGTPVSSGAITFQVSVQDTFGATAGPVTYTINVAAGPSGANNGRLNGSYVCLFQGSVDTDGTRWATLASFQADGQGNFSSGIFDTNSYDIGSASGTISGSYSVGADNNGMAFIHTVLTDGAAGIQTTQWAIALSSSAQPAQQFRMIEADDLGTLPSYQQGAANCFQATTSAFAAITISGSSFVFGIDGEDNSGIMKFTAGIFNASTGKSASGIIDTARGGSATVQTDAFTATYTAPDPASGRFTIALSGAGTSTGFTVYIIDANRMFVLDNTSNDGEQAGNMRVRRQASYSGASIAGPFVLYLSGAEFNNSGNTPSGFYADVFQGTGDGVGNMTINQSYMNNAGVYSAGSANGGPEAITFDSSHPGRATFQSASGTTYLYLFNNSSAFEMGVGNNGSVESGWLESQTQSSFTNASLAGNYLYGYLSLLNVEPSSSVGVLGVTSSGVINAALTTSSRENLSWDQSTSMTYSWDATAPGTGTFLVVNNAQVGASCAVISTTKFVCIPQNDTAPSVEVVEQ
ncbi:MAG TPA: IPT/TIG domain-containing protein [Terracidiphilus sp.]|nr:IPT/TIG domain-containing protein [Terracidiphilus sp.]